MRIDFVADAVYPYHHGGKEKRLRGLTDALVAQGHEIHVHTMHWWQEPERVIHRDGITWHALCREVKMYSGDRRSIREALAFSLACLRLVREPFDRLDVDHMPYFPVLACWIVTTVKRRPLYATWHEALDGATWRAYMGPLGRVAHVIERLSTRLPRAIGTASPATRDNLARFHRRTTRVHVVGTGVDLEAISACSPTTDDVDVLFVGRLVKDKQVALLLDALALVKEKRPSVRCLIIGSGPEDERVRTQIRDLGLDEAVRIIRSLEKSEEVFSYMKKASVLALPSKREGFGMVVAEALACGTPVVTIDSPDNASRLLVDEGVTGSVCPPTARAISDAILHWLDHAQPISAEIASEFRWDDIATRQLEVYA